MIGLKVYWRMNDMEGKSKEREKGRKEERIGLKVYWRMNEMEGKSKEREKERLNKELRTLR